jgi:hypothetical protein
MRHATWDRWKGGDHVSKRIFGNCPSWRENKFVRNPIVNGDVTGVCLLFAGGFCVGSWCEEDVLLAAGVSFFVMEYLLV